MLHPSYQQFKPLATVPRRKRTAACSTAGLYPERQGVYIPGWPPGQIGGFDRGFSMVLRVQMMIIYLIIGH